ncbi:GSCFA domain-containing protein [Aequorivita sp. F47161]|uniref:GSCFA domain-containing protein n=1 Tax=Aequorivita vitellina TaxID=2874475 RepID=A0A9X1TZX9_9FLAO|nr:GSCFA domain-containing protein [Aequorivita vitellina]MCG2418519.1 GSCFA domain-containing protein [Aequorivita vitellina]
MLSDRPSALHRKQEIVANCHKLPQQNFKKELLSTETISESIQTIFSKISDINTNAITINTVSPVRHIKDGMVENALSKAHLLTAIHANLKSKSKSVNLNSFYFPSFEIMMDELRDYRFYAEDMLHPNKTAIEIIWQKFSEVWVSSEAAVLQKEIAIIQNGLNHKPFNPQSEQHLQFSEKLQQKITAIQNRFSHIQF